MPKISIIIPVYNTAAYLPKCLDSILAQTFDDYEVILVNDGSVDNSQDVIDGYTARYPEKFFALRQKNSGQGTARNAGLQIAKGEFISFVDSDDYLHPDALRIIYKTAAEQSLDIVCFNFFSEKDGQVHPHGCSFAHSDNIVKQYILSEVSPCNKLIRRKLLAENNLFFSEGRIYEDLELIPQFALHTDKIALLPDRLYYYLIRNGSTMQQTHYNPKLNSIFPVMETMKARFAGSAYMRELEYLFIIHFLHDAYLRFLPFRKGEESLRKISRIMKETFPHWYRNKYYKTIGIKYKIVCILAYWGQIKLLRWLLKVQTA